MTDATEHGPAPTGKVPFCSEPGTPCDCKNNYRKVCEPSWAAAHLMPEKHAEFGAILRSYEAHHILCVSKIADYIVAPKHTKGYAASLDKSVWCINDRSNMIALPRWGHTIMWYSNSMSGVVYDALGAITNSAILTPTSPSVGAPPFAGLPQHDYGHRGSPPHQGYEQEVGDRLEELSKELEEAAEKHDQATLDQIAPRLTNLSGEFKGKLEARGKRVFGGTHQAWLAAAATSSAPNWYMPFGMADNPRPMAFASGQFNEGLGRKIKRIADAFFKLPKPGS
jgi:hypothetical protein